MAASLKSQCFWPIWNGKESFNRLLDPYGGPAHHQNLNTTNVGKLNLP